MSITNGRVTVNGQVLDEPYINAAPNYTGEWPVPAGSLFVLGDNRDRSADSLHEVGMKRPPIEARRIGVLDEWLRYTTPIGTAHREIKRIVARILELKAVAGKPKRQIKAENIDPALTEQVRQLVAQPIREAILIPNKTARQERLDDLLLAGPEGGVAEGLVEQAAGVGQADRLGLAGELGAPWLVRAVAPGFDTPAAELAEVARG